MDAPGAEVAVAVGSKIGDYLIRQIGGQLGYLVHYKRNIENLMKQVLELKGNRDGLQLLVDEAINNGDNILPNVQQWLESVDEFCAKATNFYEVEVKENNGCLKGWCLNLKACYTLRRKAKKMINEAAELQKRDFNKISCRAPPLPIGVTSIADFRSFESRAHTIKDIVNLLKGDEVSMIGICGMGGVGKTTMVEAIVRRVRDEKLFDEIVMAVVSQNQDSMKIQDEIAYHLGMEFEEKRSLTVRADQLWKRLLQSGKGNLVILDDMWKSFDLKEIGIPYGDEHKKCKIVLTSRNEGACKVMKCGKIFKIEVLSKKEAWSLFREMAGHDSVDASDIYLIASNVAKECGGLPISLVTVGKALNGKSKEEWDNALNQLRKSIVPATLSEVELKVYRSLRLSYDHLGSNEEKSLFLLCCFYPEDTNIPLEDLVRYGVGLRLFEDIDSLTQARDRVIALTRELKSCFLLLDGRKRFYVRLHDVVRDVGIKIARASEEIHFNMKMIDGGRWPMVKDDSYKDCNALSVISDTISDFPSGGLDCPNLEVLQLACGNLSQEALNSRNLFGGMPRLKILDMRRMPNRSLPSSVWLLMNLRVLCLNDCNWFENICEIPKGQGNLEILSINNSKWELPEDIGRLTNLRLLDMRGCSNEKIPPSVFSCLRLLEDLHTGGWRPAEEGDKSGNASFGQLESLSNLTSLATWVPHARLLPKSDFLKKLKRYAIVVGEREDLRTMNYLSRNFFLEKRTKNYLSQNCFLEKSLSLDVNCIDDAPLGGGIDHLLKQSTETLYLTGDGLKIVLDQLFPEGSVHLRKLYIRACNGRVEYLVDTGTAELVPPNIKVFEKLEKLNLNNMTHLKEICHGQQLPVGSFGCLQKMDLSNLPALTHLWEYRNQSVTLGNLRFVSVAFCNRLENLFTLSVARSLVNLESLKIQRNETMKEVISNQGPSGTTITDGVELENIHIIEFPKLIKISLWGLDSLTCFYKGMDQINLPQLTHLEVAYLPKLTSFCAEGNGNVGLQSLFNHKVKLTNLKNLKLEWLHDMTEIWSDQLDGDSFHQLKKVEVNECGSISTVVRCNMTQGFQNLEELSVSDCSLVKRVFEYGEEGSVAVVLLPPLKVLKLKKLPKLTQIWKKHIRMNHDFKELTIIRIEECHSMKHVFSTSVAKALVNLQELSVMRCDMMEQIVANDHLEGDTNELSGMMSVCSGRLYFPSLVELNLTCCVELKTFSSSSFQNAEMNKQPLFGNQVKLTNLKNLLLKGLHDMTEIWSDQLDGDSFHQLKKVEVYECRSISTVLRCNMTQVFQNLEELHVKQCSLVEGVFEYGEEGSPAVVLLPRLKELKLSYLPKLTQIWKKHIRMNHGFRELSFIHIEECHSMKHVFSTSVAKALVKLQELHVKECYMLEQIVANDHPEGDTSELSGMMEFRNLRSLSLHNLDKLKWCVELKTFSSSSFQNAEMNKQPLFGNQVKLTNLKNLLLKGLHDMTEIWSDQLDGDSFHQLKKVEVNECGSISTVVRCNMTQGFQNLEELSVSDCSLVKRVFEYGEEGSVAVVLLPPLKVLKLKKLPKLTQIWKKHIRMNHDFKELTIIRIEECHSMKHVFSTSVAKALVNLQELSVMMCDMMEQIVANDHLEGDTNELSGMMSVCSGRLYFPSLTELNLTCCVELKTFSSSSFQNAEMNKQPLFGNQVKLTNLKNLTLLSLDDMTEIWSDQLDGDSFHELKKVEVYHCDRISTVLRCNMTQVFQNLEELWVEGCDLVEGVFEYGEEGSVAVVLLPRLKELKLSYLPKLTQIWKKHIRMNHDFRELNFIRIERCHSMKHVFSTSVAKALVKLQELCVERCEMMEQIVANDHPEGETSELSGMMEFQYLRSLSLRNLDELKSFSSSSFMNAEINSQPLFGNQVTFPILEKLDIWGLPNFEELWCSQIPTGSFQKVRVLDVWKCDKLLKVSSIARGLVYLQRLVVSSCPMIEEIFMVKADEDGREDKTLFPALEILQLGELPRLKSFCNVNYTIELPVLNKVRIFDCSEMTTFSSSFIRTPKLGGVNISENWRWGDKIIWMGDLNKTIEHLFKEKETQEQES